MPRFRCLTFKRPRPARQPYNIMSGSESNTVRPPTHAESFWPINTTVAIHDDNDNNDTSPCSGAFNAVSASVASQPRQRIGV